MGQAKLGCQLFERPSQPDCAAVRANVEREKMSDSIACRSNVATLKTGPQRHHLLGQHGREGLHHFGIALELGDQDRLRVEPNHGLSDCDRIAVVCRREQRGLGEGIPRHRDLKDGLVTAPIDTCKPDFTLDDLVEPGCLVAGTKEGLTRAQRAVDCGFSSGG